MHSGDTVSLEGCLCVCVPVCVRVYACMRVCVRSFVVVVAGGLPLRTLPSVVRNSLVLRRKQARSCW